MPAVLTSVQIDQTAQLGGLVGTGVCQPEFEAPNGDLYQIMIALGGPPFNVVVGRSTNKGRTWSNQDVVHQPVGAIGSIIQSFFRPTDGTNGIITFCYSTATANRLKWGQFDCGTNQYILGVIADLTDAPNDRGLPSYPFTVRADGSILVLYHNNVDTHNMGFRIYSAGAWSAFTIVLNTVGHSYFPQGVVITSGVSFFVFLDTTNPTLNIGGYYGVPILNAAGAVTAKIDDMRQSDIFNQPVLSGGVMYVPLVRGSANGLTSTAEVFSTPDFINWTVRVLDTQGHNEIVSSTVADNNGVPEFLWTFEDSSGSPNVIRRSTNFGPTSTYFDVRATPPNLVGLTFQFASQVNAAVLSDGTLVATVSFLTYPPASGNVFGAFFMPAGLGNGLRLIIPNPVKVIVLPNPNILCCFGLHKCPQSSGRQKFSMVRGRTQYV